MLEPGGGAVLSDQLFAAMLGSTLAIIAAILGGIVGGLFLLCSSEPAKKAGR
jgi:hypothetical protein